MSPRVTVVLWLWGKGYTGDGWRPVYSAEHVNTMARMVRMHLSHVRRIVCVTDMPEGITECETLPLWDDYAGLGLRRRSPNSFRRLKLFSPEFQFYTLKLNDGDYLLHMDLDAVICGSLDHLVTGHDDFRIATGYRVCPYNGSLWLVRAGAQRQVWDRFNPLTSPVACKQSGHVGSDQVWMALAAPNAPLFTPQQHGVYDYRHLPQPRSKRPENTAAVFFAGAIKPWSAQLKLRSQGKWLADAYARFS